MPGSLSRLFPQLPHLSTATSPLSKKTPCSFTPASPLALPSVRDPEASLMPQLWRGVLLLCLLLPQHPSCCCLFLFSRLPSPPDGEGWSWIFYPSISTVYRLYLYCAHQKIHNEWMNRQLVVADWGHWNAAVLCAWLKRFTLILEECNTCGRLDFKSVVKW